MMVLVALVLKKGSLFFLSHALYFSAVALGSREGGAAAYHSLNGDAGRHAQRKQ